MERDLRNLSPEKIRLLTTTRPDQELPEYRILCNGCDELKYFYYRCLDCPQHRKERFDLCYNCRIVEMKFCSRDESHGFALPNEFAVTIEIPEGDLDLFVRSEITNQMPRAPEPGADSDMVSPRWYATRLGMECAKDSELFNKIVFAIVTNAEGRFLLAEQAVKSLAEQMTLKAINKAVQEIEEHRDKGSDIITKRYAEDMERIKNQGAKSKIAFQILSWVTGTFRNLTLAELLHALATEDGDTDYDPEGEVDEHIIASVTKGLIKIDRDGSPTSRVVRLTHRTLAEFFDQARRKLYFEQGDIEIAKTCLIYLSFRTFSKPVPVEDFAVKEQAHPFFAYALEYWGDHVRKAGPTMDDAVMRYLKDPAHVQAYIQAAWTADTQDVDKWDCRRDVHPLHILAWFDLPYLISALDYQVLNLDVCDGTYGQTPLMYACRRGNLDTVRRLLELEASVNLVSARGRTALFEAVRRKKLDAVDLLLNAPLRNQSLDVNIRNPKAHNRTALLFAIRKGYVKIALMILKHPNLSINTQDSEGHTALSLAAYMGLTPVVSEILSPTNKFTPELVIDLVEYSGRCSALILAVEDNHVEAVDLLLNHGADANLRDRRGGTAALAAVEEGSMESLQSLIMFNADVFCVDEFGRTLLHAAAETGDVEMIALLHTKGLQVNTTDEYGATPFHSACRCGHLEAGSNLLQLGADSSMLDNFNRTPFTVAWQYGKSALMDLCRDKGNNREADSSQDISPKHLPLWSHVNLRHVEFVTAAISSKGDDQTVKEPGLENTTLHCAIIPNPNDDKRGAKRLEILRELLTAGNPFLDEPDKYGRTPLHLAAVYDDLEATTLLLEHNPSLDTVDRYGLTPLQIACQGEEYGIALTLIEAEAEIDDSKIDLERLLFAAISLKRNQAVIDLIRAGADPLSQDENGRTIDMMAKSFGNKELLSYLQKQRSFMYQMRRDTDRKDVVDAVQVKVFDDLVSQNIPIRTFRSRPVDLVE